MSPKNFCFGSTFSQTHRQTQRIHFWIALCLRNVKKLVPCQTNTRILSYDHFSAEKIRKILDHSWRQFSLNPNYSKSREGSTSHIAVRQRNLISVFTSHITLQAEKTCMRAVNRQPTFTARGTRRAFSPSNPDRCLNTRGLARTHS